MAEHKIRDLNDILYDYVATCEHYNIGLSLIREGKVEGADKVFEETMEAVRVELEKYDRELCNHPAINHDNDKFMTIVNEYSDGEYC